MAYNRLNDVVDGLLYADGFLAGIRDWLGGPKPDDAAAVAGVMATLDGLRVKYEAELAPENAGDA